MGVVGFAGFIRARHGSHRVNSASLAEFGCEASGSLGFVGFILASSGGCRVHSDSLGSFGLAVTSGSLGFASFAGALRVVGFIRVGWAHSCPPPPPLMVIVFIEARPGRLRVQLDSCWRTLGVVGFNRVG